MKISVLMSIYIGTEAKEFSDCLASIARQTLPPSEIVVVFDGPVQSSVDTALNSFMAKSTIPVRALPFPNNRGLGPALADGVVACRYPLIARADTDDVNAEERFAWQAQCFESDESLSLVGGQLEEIYQTPDGVRSLIRPIPLTPAQICTTARYRNPLNHPTVMFRRDHVLDAGNYRSMLWFEDYYLWANMIMRGYRFVNLDRILVTATADEDYFRRRGGLKYLRQEWKLTRALRSIGFHTPLQSAKFFVSRFLFRLVPVALRSRFYTRILRRQPGLSS